MTEQQDSEYIVVREKYLKLFPSDPFPIRTEETSSYGSFVGNIKVLKEKYWEESECISLMNMAISENKPLVFSNENFSI